MGVKGLYSYLKAYRSTFYPASYKGPPLRIAIDGMSMLYKYKSGFQDLYPLLDLFQEQGHRLIVVFDGKPPKEKEEEVRERRDARSGAASQAETLKKYLTESTDTIDSAERRVLEVSIARLEFQGWHMTRDIRHSFQDALKAREIPFLKATQEADEVLTDLAMAGKVDVVISTDMDFLLSGVERLWIPLGGTMSGFEEIRLSEVLAGEDLTIEALRDAGILCGVEPLRGKVAMPAHTAFSLIRHYGSLEGVVAKRGGEFALEVLQDPEQIRAVRDHFLPVAEWHTRIREDHWEAVRDVLLAF